ncbi:hypothetical protein MLD38_022195 [Melastoma candidum]|uniref:Uncharacterized protein n=1 Tax=Melastoma candidum TaxID=119954 RepID=A0ACB9QJ03_9MYRT|nr:hypothetical protein MLD38_022195 [Melastoma candidum]
MGGSPSGNLQVNETVSPLGFATPSCVLHLILDSIRLHSPASSGKGEGREKKIGVRSHIVPEGEERTENSWDSPLREGRLNHSEKKKQDRTGERVQGVGKPRLEGLETALFAEQGKRASVRG